MGLIQRWNADQIINEIRLCYREAASSYNDGWTAWSCKQDLYRVKFELDEMLKNCPTFAGEQEWLKEQKIEQDKQRAWRELKQV